MATTDNSKATSKRQLDIRGLNRVLGIKSNDTYRARLKEAQSDPLGYVRQHFRLSRKQEDALASISPKDLAGLRKTIATAQKNNYRIRVVFTRTSPSTMESNASTRLRQTRSQKSQKKTNIKLEYGCEGKGGLPGGFEGECTVAVKGETDIC